MAREYEVAVVGGGLLGSSLAWGIGRLGQRVVVLDEGDIAKRASRANFALVWVQTKGLGLPEYTSWTLRASETWVELARALEDETGLDVCFRRPGGFHLALSDREMALRRDTLARLHNQPGAADYRTELLDHADVRRMMPDIGPEVAGGSYCPYDGHVNSLRVFRALHAAFTRHGVDYRPEHAVTAISVENGAFRLTTKRGEIVAGKVVLAAGNANAVLAPMVGLSAPMEPNRGQIVVTERAAPFLHFPMTTLRQSDEGTVMIGDSKEEETDDSAHHMPIDVVMANRAVRMFPKLAALNVVRAWSGIRVMTRDGFPIYDQSESHPGAFVVCCHSGVTLAPNHAFDIAPMIARGRLEEAVVGAFSARRFAGQTGERAA
ncbi:MAG TPA: FAD-dependent oxidoreductase [Rhabdaerophilum sp.]|nr:FAD-dependent oxidoreductase [Rhabdaerophilum sp.]